MARKAQAIAEDMGVGLITASPRPAACGRGKDTAMDHWRQGTRKQPVFPQRTENKRVFQHRKTNAVFLFCFSPAMVLLAAGASPGAAPCNTPPGPFSLPFNPKAFRAGWRGPQNKKLPARSSETLPLLVKKSNDTDLCQSRSSCSLARR